MAKTFPLLCASSVTALLLVGCGSDSQETSSAKPASTPKPMAESAPKAEPMKQESSASQMVEQAKQDVEQKAAEMANKAGEMKDEMKQQASETMEKVEAKASEMVASTTAAAGGSAAGEATYKSLCFSCHDNAIAGAPKLGDKAAWEPRLATGIDAIYNTALNGKGAMPAKGGNPALSDADVKAAVDYMLSTVN